MRDTLQQDPASFSPNVFLRPLYQETILPNVAYIPGPAEFNYWLQMKQLFAVHNLVMPVVIPRTLTQFLSIKNYEKIITGPIPLDDYFLPYSAFLDVITHIDADALSDTQSVINTLQDTVSTLQEKLTQKHISHKKITKSLTALLQEIQTLSQSVDQATKTTIEESESYAPYIKLYKNFFDIEQRFERNNYVIGQLSVIDQMLHVGSLPYEAGKVLLYIYD